MHVKLRKLSSDCNSLPDVRLAIDEIDREIVSLIGERSHYVMRAAAYKTSLSSVEAKDRVAQVLNTRRNWAQEIGVSPDMVESLFENMIKYFIAQESEEWQRRVSKED